MVTPFHFLLSSMPDRRQVLRGREYVFHREIAKVCGQLERFPREPWLRDMKHCQNGIHVCADTMNKARMQCILQLVHFWSYGRIKVVALEPVSSNEERWLN